jgi:sulfate adenylyltransferase subunit 1 (EFTu-like GTPase family)
VTYRRFPTLRREFIIADTPNHGHYARNMVTGAGTADLAVILVDAGQGRAPAVEASRDHRVLPGDAARGAGVNKMDLVDYSCRLSG